MLNTDRNFSDGSSFGRKIKKLFKDTGLFAISNFASKILIFLLTPLYTQVLSTAEYGIADLIVNSVNFIYPILTLAIAEGTLRFAMDKDNVCKERVLSTSLAFVNISVVLLVAACPIVALIDHSFFKWFVIFTVIYTLYNYHNCLSNYLKAIGKTALFAVQGIVMTCTVVIFNILFLLVFKIGLYGYLISIIAGYALSVAMMLIFGKVDLRNIYRVDKPLLKEMIRYSIPMVPTLLAWSVNSYTDRYMIIGFIGLDASGLYSVAHKIPSLLTAVIAVFAQAWQLSAIENYGDKDEGDYYSDVYRYYDYICVLACISVIILTKPFATFLYSNDYFVAWKYVPILTVSALFSSLAGFLAAAFRASKKTGGLFWSVVISSLLNVVVNMILIPTCGIMGAAAATAFSFMVMWAIRLYLIRKIVNLKVHFISTVSTYLLIVVSVVLTTLDIPGAVLYSIVCLALVVLIHTKENIDALNMAKTVFLKLKGDNKK